MSLTTAGPGMGAMQPMMTANIPQPVMSGNSAAIYNAPPSFQPNAHQGHNSSCCGGGGYDIHDADTTSASSEDMHACLGIAIGATSYSAFLFLPEKGAIPLTGRTPLPAALWLDPKTGSRNLRKWVKRENRSQKLPKDIVMGLKEGDEKGGDMIRVSAGTGLLAVSHREEGLMMMQKTSPLKIQLVNDKESEEFSGVRISLPEDDEGKVWSGCEPEHLLAVLLVSLKLKVLAAFKVTCVTCAFTVPTWFNDSSRVSFQCAIFLAGMHPGRYISSPLSMAIGYFYKPEKGLISDVTQNKVVAVIRLGGGGVSMNLIQFGDEGYFEVLNSCGAWGIGGANMDYTIAKKIQGDIEKKFGDTVDSECFVRILNLARNAREILSDQQTTTISLTKGSIPSKPEFEYSTELTRMDMELCLAPMLREFSEMLVRLKSIDNLPNIESVLLGGGVAQHMPAIERTVKEAFQNVPISIIDSMEVSKGAAIVLAGDRGLSSEGNVKAEDVLSLPISLIHAGNESKADILFSKNTRLPAVTTRTFDSRKGFERGTKIRIVQPLGEHGYESEKQITIHDLGDPLMQYDDSGYPAPATITTVEFTIDLCGIFCSEVQDFEVPPRKDKGKFRKMLNLLVFVVAMVAIIFGGYFKLKAMAEQPAKDMINARERLTKFYEAVNPSKLSSVEDTIRRYAGRYEVLFKRLEDRYDLPV